jgi:hypothetical protein
VYLLNVDASNTSSTELDKENKLSVCWELLFVKPPSHAGS